MDTDFCKQDVYSVLIDYLIFWKILYVILNYCIQKQEILTWAWS